MAEVLHKQFNPFKCFPPFAKCSDVAIFLTALRMTSSSLLRSSEEKSSAHPDFLYGLKNNIPIPFFFFCGEFQCPSRLTRGKLSRCIRVLVITCLTTSLSCRIVGATSASIHPFFCPIFESHPFHTKFKDLIGFRIIL